MQFDYSVTPAFPDSVFITNTQSDRTGYLAGNKILEQIDNLSNRAQKVTYTVTPYTVTQSGAVRCTGTPYSTDIWVEPTATMYFVPVQDTICDNIITDIELRSITEPTLPVRFDYTVTAAYPDSVTIANTLPDRTGYLEGEKVLERIDNLSNRPQKITYTATPYTVTQNGLVHCTGSHYSVDVWVNPTPRATPVNVKPEICFAENNQIALASPTIMTSGEIKFDYSITIPSGVTGNSGSGSDKSQGDILSFQYRNYNDTVQSVYFSITPKVSG